MTRKERRTGEHPQWSTCRISSTSFVLSFLLAVGARNIWEAQISSLLREFGQELLANPLVFLPPRR
jgi:hypothetical protein